MEAKEEINANMVLCIPAKKFNEILASLKGPTAALKWFESASFRLLSMFPEH